LNFVDLSFASMIFGGFLVLLVLSGAINAV